MVCFSYFFSAGRLAGRRLVQPDHHAVHPGPGEPLGLQLAQQFGVLALAPADHRREHLEPGALVEFEHPVHDLLRGLPGDRPAADRAVRLAHPRVQQPQVVVDLGDRADGGPRVAAGRLLVDRHRRGQPVDEVHVGLVHLAEELPGVRGQRLDVPALALGEDRVEGQAGLARAGQPGEHDQGVPGQVERHVLEVVLARTADNQTISHCALFSWVTWAAQLDKGHVMVSGGTDKTRRAVRHSRSPGRPARNPPGRSSSLRTPVPRGPAPGCTASEDGPEARRGSSAWTTRSASPWTGSRRRPTALLATAAALTDAQVRGAVAAARLDPRARADPHRPQRRRPGQPAALGAHRHRDPDVRQPRGRAGPTSRRAPAAPRPSWPPTCAIRRPRSPPRRPACRTRPGRPRSAR